MHHLITVVVTALVAFTVTNIDDLVLLGVLFLSSRASGEIRTRQIVLGQYVGLAVLVGLSIVGALGLAAVSDSWAGLFGLVPLGLGLRGLAIAIRTRNQQDASPPARVDATIHVAAATIATGADNIAVYVPLFRTLNVADLVVTLVEFGVLLAGYCVVGSWLASRKQMVILTERYSHWLVPVMYIALGLVILFKTDALQQLLRLV